MIILRAHQYKRKARAFPKKNSLFSLNIEWFNEAVSKSFVANREADHLSVLITTLVDEIDLFDSIFIAYFLT